MSRQLKAWVGNNIFGLKPVYCLFLLAFIALSAGCGFQLRGSGVESSLQSVYVSSARNVQLYGLLRQRLSGLGITLTGSQQGTEMSVHLISDTFKRRTISVTGRALAAEYELIMVARYSIGLTEDSSEAIEHSLEVSRIFAIDQGNLVGSSEEQVLLVGEMREDLVQQIIRHMNTLAR